LRDAGAFPKDTDVIKDADAGNLFKNKISAMQLDGSWFANGVSDKKNTTIVAFPTVPGGMKAPSDIIAGFSSGFYITKKAWNDPDKRKAAVDFVMTHTSTASIAKYWGGAGTPAAACKTPTGLPKLMADGAKMAAAAKGFDSATDSRLKPEAYGTLLRSISDISTGKITAKEAMKNVVKINAK
jgi:raffinose/stachyose/melibiose transport system substrate-binding protein